MLNQEDFLDLSVAVSGTSSLEFGLRNNYCDTETMSGKNQYRCENCNKLVDAKKVCKLVLKILNSIYFNLLTNLNGHGHDIGKMVELQVHPYLKKLYCAQKVVCSFGLIKLIKEYIL